MSTQPSRILMLLADKGIRVTGTADASAPKLERSRGAWTYATVDGRIRLWVYAFAGQEELDRALELLEDAQRSRGGGVELAQNGEFLLAIPTTASDASSDELRDEMDRVLSAFSGEVER